MKSYILFVSGMKPYAHILLKEIQEAEESLIQTRELFSPKERILPFALSNFYLSQFLFDLFRLEESIMHDSKTNLSNLKKNAFISGKSAIKNSMKFAPNKPEVFRLMGLYYWLTGRQKEALKWWDKSINIGNYLGARPELARTFMELGKRLLEEKSKLRQWQGIEAEEYLNKARVIFEEMELNYDLQELEKIGI
ncbi:hypothetical protein KA005_83090 [bacterium]|nr:hypothetical protein [bacterium]